MAQRIGRHDRPRRRPGLECGGVYDLPLLPVRILHSEPALGKVRALAADSSGDLLWAGADSGVVLEIRLPEGAVLRRFHAHKGGVNAISHSEGRVATGGNDGHVRVWEPARLECLLTLRAPGKRVHSVDLSTSQPGEVSVLTFGGWRAAWDLAGRPTMESVCLGPQAVEDLHRGAWPISDGQRLVAVGDGAVRLAMVESITEQETIPLPIACEPLARACRQKRVHVVGRLSDRKHVLLALDLETRAFAGPWLLPYGVACLTFWRGEGTLYAGGNGRLFAIDLPAP